MAKITFGKEFGYLDKNEDFDGQQAVGESSQVYLSTIGQMPFLDKLLDKNPIYRIGPPTFTAIAHTMYQQLCAYKDDAKPSQEKGSSFLEKYVNLKAEYPDIGDAEVVGLMIVNVARVHLVMVVSRSGVHCRTQVECEPSPRKVSASWSFAPT